MQLTLEPAVDIQLEFQFARDKTDGPKDGLGSYELVGPPSRLQLLQKTGAVKTKESGELDVSGKMSPVAPLSLPDRTRRCIGVPSAATHFSFAYPAMSGGESLEEALETLNLADELWAFFLLVGGYCYFTVNAEGKFELLQSNALVLVPSDYTLELTGPHTPDPSAIAGLHKKGRLVDVTLDVLEEQGFAAFGWILPDELADNVPLTKDTTYPYGGFLYEMKNGVPPTFFAVQAPSEEKLKLFDEKEEERLQAEKSKFSIAGKVRRMRKDYAKAQAEIAEMNKLTDTAGESRGGLWKSLKRYYLPKYMPFVCTFSVVVGLASLGFVSPYTMEICATGLWYSFFVYTVWVPFRDTAAMSVLAGAKRKQLTMTLMLVSIPMLIVLVQAAAITYTTASRANAPSALEAFARADELAELAATRERFDITIELSLIHI